MTSIELQKTLPPLLAAAMLATATSLARAQAALPDQQGLAKLIAAVGNFQGAAHHEQVARCGDKALNQYGNPAIMLSRDSATHSASFQLALEQGP